MYTIEIDDEVFEYLKKNAEPFIDTPNSVHGGFKCSPLGITSWSAESPGADS